MLLVTCKNKLGRGGRGGTAKRLGVCIQPPTLDGNAHDGGGEAHSSLRSYPEHDDTNSIQNNFCITTMLYHLRTQTWYSTQVHVSRVEFDTRRERHRHEIPNAMLQLHYLKARCRHCTEHLSPLILPLLSLLGLYFSLAPFLSQYGHSPTLTFTLSQDTINYGIHWLNNMRQSAFYLRADLVVVHASKVLSKESCTSNERNGRR